MHLISFIGVVVPIFVITGAVPQRLRPQCRSNVCDDRPECPRTSCKCLFASRMDCAVYYHCVDGKPYQYRCSPGLLFNAETLSCDYSYNVNCSFSTTETVSSSTSIITTESTTTKTTEESITNTTTREPTTIRTTQEPTMTSTIKEPTTTAEHSTIRTTEKFSTTETTKPTTSETTEEPTTIRTTEKHTTIITTEPTTIKTTQEPTTIRTTDKHTTIITTEPTTLKTTEEPTTIRTTEKHTTVTTKEPTTIKTTEEPTTIRTTEKHTTTETIEPTTIKTTEQPYTIKTTEKYTTTETKNPTTNEVTEKSSSILTTQKDTTTTEFSTTTTTGEPTSNKTTKYLTSVKTTEEPTTIESTSEQSTTRSTEKLLTTTTSSETTPTTEKSTTLRTTERLPTTKSSEESPKTEISSISANVTQTEIIPTVYTPKEPGSDFECPSRFGLFPDPKSCFRFYHCSHWIPYHKWCPSNLHFNPKLKVCDWPYRAGCDAFIPTPNEPESPVTSNPNTTLDSCDCEYCELPVLGDCGAYILCIDRVAHKMRCSPGLLFDPMTGTCDHQENVACAEDSFDCPNPSGRYLLPGSCSYFIECHSGEKVIKKCPEGLQFNSTSEMCSWVGSCSGSLPDDGSESKVVADYALCNGCDYCFKPAADDCSKFVKCFQNRVTEDLCASGLFFNAETEMCDHDYNVECPETPPQPVCPEKFGYFPYPGECGSYLQCINGSATVKSCPGILHFDPVKKHCDYPWAAGCAGNDSVPTPEPSANETECDCDCCLKPVGTDCRSFVLCINKIGFEKSCSSGLFFNPNTENCDFAENVECTVSPEVPGFYCPEHQGLFPHPEDCHKFIHCAHGIPYVKDCPSKLHFNPKLKVCDWPYSAGCNGSATNDPTTGDNDNSSLPCDVCDSCFISDQEDCASYVYCRKGKGYRLRCTENLLFNPDIDACDLPSNVECPGQPSSKCPRADGLFPAEDCSQFIHCSNGIAYLKDCPDRLQFNPQLLVCDWPENVKCGDIPITPAPPNDDNNEDSNFTCNCDCCFLPYNNDCSKYILCLDGYQHVGQCSTGLLFNNSIQNCDLAERVTCKEVSPSCPEPNGLFPNSGKCSSFLKCSNGISEVEYCQNGTHFSAERKQCLDPCQAKCETNYDCTTMPANVTSSTPSPSICIEPDGFYPVSNDCTSFYVCSDEKPQLVNCPTGLHYNAEYETCEDPCDAKCDRNLDCSTPETKLKSTPSPVPSTVDPHCIKGDGLFSVEGDCSSFYQCIGGKAKLKQCPSGLHFSDVHKLCEHPCEAKCNASLDCSTPVTSSERTSSPSPVTTDPRCLQGDGLFADKNDCSSFYHCSGGRPHYLKCPSGLHFSDIHQACEYPCEAKCNSSLDCTSTTPKSVSTPSPHCPTPEGLYPVLGDCSAFYLCSNDKEYVIHCPPGLHYSEKDEICENPCIAQCNASIDCETSTRLISSSTTPHPISAECTEPDGLFLNPNDCGSFFQCSNGISHLIYCPNGLHFSPDDAACEKPCVAGCNITIDCPPEYPDTTGNCSCDACYLPDPSDCSAYYFCDKGRLVKGYCPFGTLFSKTSSTCEDENGVDCEANGDPSMCPELFGFYPYPGDCRKFVHCDNGVAHIKECSGSLEYDPVGKVCTRPQGYCGDVIQDPNCPQPTGMFPDPTNCSLFYHCENGVAYPKRCSPPLMFNPSQKVCDWPENVACGRSTTEISSSSISPNSSTPNPTPSDETPSIPPCVEVPGVICPCACRVPTYDECSSYFQCQEDGTACKRHCPDGLYFNKIDMVCDLPENVECRDFFFSSLRRAKQLGHRSKILSPRLQ